MAEIIIFTINLSQFDVKINCINIYLIIKQMLAVILRIFILVAILFFPGKALWEYINKQNHIKQAVVLSAKEVQENISQLTYAEQEKPKVEE